MSMNIAVIDSDKSTADFVKRCFNNKKVNVDLFHTASEFNKKGADGYQLLVICHELPDTKGLKLNDKIKSNNKFSDLPVIIISASLKSKELISHQRGQYGANSYLKKPFTAEKFRDDVVTVLGEEAVGVRKDPTESTQKGNTLPREITAEDEFENAKGSTLIFDVNDLKNLDNLNDEHPENTNPNLGKKETTAGFELNFEKTQVAKSEDENLPEASMKAEEAEETTNEAEIDASDYDLVDDSPEVH
jgi:CheY-like chemotaxis protein